MSIYDGENFFRDADYPLWIAHNSCPVNDSYGYLPAVAHSQEKGLTVFVIQFKMWRDQTVQCPAQERDNRPVQHGFFTRRVQCVETVKCTNERNGVSGFSFRRLHVRHLLNDNYAGR